jgi:hypothetical protein
MNDIENEKPDAPKPDNLAKARAAKAAKAAERAAAPKAQPPAPPPLVAREFDPDAPLLTDEDRERIRLKAVKQVQDDRKKAAEAQLLAQELEKLRGKANEITGDPVMDEIVNIIVDTGANTDKLLIDGRIFQHGVMYPVPRHKAESMREMMWRSQMHEHAITGKPLLEFYQRKRNTVISRAGVVNPPRNPGERVL